jgi:CheY-like chemotaxis protein
LSQTGDEMKKVVVADASPTIKSVVDSLLRQQGYDVVCTSDGLQAWEVVQAERPDLVLVGLNLSGIPGLELCLQMSGDQLAGEIPVVLLIGARDNLTEEQLISSGARGRLKKPFSPRDLLEMIAKLIGPGERQSSGQPDAAEGTPRTSYKADLISSTRHLDKGPEEVYNLDWTDLKDMNGEESDTPVKVTGLDASEQDQELLIDEDQFNLIHGPAEDEIAETASKPEDDEDYSWFIGEMKREIEDPEPRDKSEIPAAPKKVSSIHVKPSSTDALKYDDLRSSESDRAIRPAARPAVDRDFKPESVVRAEQPRAKFSGTEIDKIADRVASKLAVHIAARIDKKAIFKAVKSVLDSLDS